MSASVVAPNASNRGDGQHFGAKPVSLGESLVRAGFVTADELSAALTEQTTKKQRLGEVLLELGFISEDDLLPFLGEQLGVPAVRLREGLIDPEAVPLLPQKEAERLQALPLFRVRESLAVAMAEPQNLLFVDELERITDRRILPVFTLHTALQNMIPRAYESDFAVDSVTADLDSDAVTLEHETLEIDLQKVESMADGSPVVNLVNYVIVHAVRQKASDVHIEPGIRHSSIRFRVDGQLRDVLKPRKDIHPAIVSRLKVMAKLDIAEHRMPQDGRIHVVVEGREIDMRVSTLPTVRGEKVVLRVLDRKSITFDLDRLGISTGQLTRIRRMLARPHGLLLVTGPTGSGKTTTLYSALELVKSVEKNILTVEDPVEYQLELINQIQVGASRGMNFATVLRAILRQDPDVIMVGEIRDRETAEVAIQAALTGHLVLSTLHTNDAPSAVTRLMDMGVESFKIAAALVGVIAQRLLRKVCTSCKAPYYAPAEQLDEIGYTGDYRRQFVRGEGCRECFDTGFQGRIGIYEVMPTTRQLRELIARNPDLELIRECHLNNGGTTLLQEGQRLAEELRTSLDEVMRAAHAD